MKANETPEKIYLYPSDRAGENYEDEWGTMPWGEDYVEYTRTDAFIEKSCEFIRKGGKRGDVYIVTEFGEEVFDFVQFAEDFKNYMKGE